MLNSSKHHKSPYHSWRIFLLKTNKAWIRQCSFKWALWSNKEKTWIGCLRCQKPQRTSIKNNICIKRPSIIEKQSWGGERGCNRFDVSHTKEQLIPQSNWLLELVNTMILFPLKSIKLFISWNTSKLTYQSVSAEWINFLKLFRLELAIVC